MLPSTHEKPITVNHSHKSQKAACNIEFSFFNTRCLQSNAKVSPIHNQNTMPRWPWRLFHISCTMATRAQVYISFCASTGGNNPFCTKGHNQKQLLPWTSNNRWCPDKQLIKWLSRSQEIKNQLHLLACAKARMTWTAVLPGSQCSTWQKGGWARSTCTLHLFSTAVLWIRPDPATAPRAPQVGTELLSSEFKCLERNFLPEKRFGAK